MKEEWTNKPLVDWLSTKISPIFSWVGFQYNFFII